MFLREAVLMMEILAKCSWNHLGKDIVQLERKVKTEVVCSKTEFLQWMDIFSQISILLGRLQDWKIVQVRKANSHCNCLWSHSPYSVVLTKNTSFSLLARSPSIWFCKDQKNAVLSMVAESLWSDTWQQSSNLVQGLRVVLHKLRQAIIK